ncbi:hypothetical protein G6F65_022241 [Rhizopus arrhizus]|nr:hypothetical protein G6F65_022241 [Rhizopus arrhizus]
MVALELNDANGKPDAEAVKRVQARALEQGLILLSCGVYGNVLRFLYPLTIPDAQFDRALVILSEALAAGCPGPEHPIFGWAGMAIAGVLRFTATPAAVSWPCCISFKETPIMTALTHPLG